MAQLLEDFDWTQSPAHIWFLKRFMTPYVFDPDNHWTNQYMNESPRKAFERLIREGALVQASVEEKANSKFLVADLRDMLAELGLRTGGSKKELIKRLLEFDPTYLEKVTADVSLVRCSEKALQAIEAYENNRLMVLKQAKEKSYQALLNGNHRDAIKEYVNFLNTYVYFARTGDNPYKYELEQSAKNIPFILSSSPKVLGNISSSNLTILRAAAALSELWKDRYVSSWAAGWEPYELPVGIIPNDPDGERALQLLLTYARLQQELDEARRYDQKIRIEFEYSDTESCEHCMIYDGKEFSIQDFPELPDQRCISETGCQCRLRPIPSYSSGLTRYIGYEDEEDEEDDELLELGDDVESGFVPIDDDDDMNGTDLFETLMQLKKMLDHQLITEEEYQQKKTEILSRM